MMMTSTVRWNYYVVSTLKVWISFRCQSLAMINLFGFVIYHKYHNWIAYEMCQILLPKPKQCPTFSTVTFKNRSLINSFVVTRIKLWYLNDNSLRYKIRNWVECKPRRALHSKIQMQTVARCRGIECQCRNRNAIVCHKSIWLIVYLVFDKW